MPSLNYGTFSVVLIVCCGFHAAPQSFPQYVSDKKKKMQKSFCQLKRNTSISNGVIKEEAKSYNII